VNRRNVPAGIASAVWLIVVAFPIYVIVVTSLRPADAYLSGGVLSLPRSLSLDNYERALRLGLSGFLANSAVVAVATMALTLACALPAAYCIVRNRSRLVRTGLSLFLLGLAIPAQAVIVPVYLIITRMHLYDSPTAIVLPTAAFSLPLAIVVLTSSLRDIPTELYESMQLDGAGNGLIFRRLVLPLSRPGLITVGIVAGLNAWNGILFPLVLTQSARARVVPLGLWNFQNEHGTDVPGLMAAVVLSALPMLLLYLVGRRYLLRGLAAGFGR